MKYIRYLLYLLLEAGLIGGGLAVLSAFGLVDLAHFNLLSKPFLALLGCTLLPLLGALPRKGVPSLPKSEGISCDYLRLSCSCDGSLQLRAEDTKDLFKEVMDSVFAGDRCFHLDYEEELYLEYGPEGLIETLDPKKPRRRRFGSHVEIELEMSDTGTAYRVVSKTDNPIVELSNAENEANIAFITRRLGEVLASRVAGEIPDAEGERGLAAAASDQGVDDGE